ncbi:MAG: hypothetical protein U0270_17745 [Labilithrix sp.]
MAHGGGAPDVAVPIATAALAAAAGLEDDRALLYSDLIRVSLGEAARRAFEDIMANGNYEYQSDFHKKADAAGRLKWEAKALLLFLESRSITVSDEQRARIDACTDPTTLETWIRKAASVASADELFAD